MALLIRQRINKRRHSYFNVFFVFFFLICISCDRIIDSVQDDLLNNDDGDYLEDILTFPGMRFHQSMVFYNNAAFFLVPIDEKLFCDIYNIKEKELVAELELPCDGFKVPHANTTCLSGHFASSDSIVPTMYVSSWNQQRHAFVYDIVLENGQIKPHLIQIIDPNNVSEITLGGGYLDWVVDADNGFLYSISYHLKETAKVITDNYTHITKFKLPSLDEYIVQFEDSDVVDSFLVPVMPVFQDKLFWDNHIYVVAGFYDEANRFPPTLYDIDIEKRTLIQNSLPFKGEPEGFCYYQGHKWINMDGWIKVHNLDCAMAKE